MAAGRESRAITVICIATVAAIAVILLVCGARTVAHLKATFINSCVATPARAAQAGPPRDEGPEQNSEED